MKTRDLLEETRFDADTADRLDKEAGIVRNVKIVGLKSQHGYKYPKKTLSTAIPLYEGMKVNVDHPPRSKPGASRSYRDRFARLRQVHFVEDSGLHGDLHYNKKHQLAEQFEYDVEHDPENVGLSHNARGPVRRRNGSLVCESIDQVRSVDLVADPATTSSLFEDKGDESMTKVLVPKRKKKAGNEKSPREKLRDIIEDRFDLDELEDDTVDELLENLEMAAAPVASPESGGGDESVDGLVSLIRKVLSDGNISPDESIKKATKIMRALKEMIPGKVEGKGQSDEDALAEGKGENEEDDDGTVNKDDRMESLMSELEVRDLCEDLGFRPTKVQRKALSALETEEERKTLIESWQDASDSSTSKKPKSRASGGKPKTYKDSKEFASGLLV